MLFLNYNLLQKVKPKGRPPGAKNKKRSIAQVDLEGSTRRDSSRFEHEAKVRKTGTKSQDNINASEGGKGEIRVMAVVRKRSKPKLRRTKYRLITWALMEKRRK